MGSEMCIRDSHHPLHGLDNKMMVLRGSLPAPQPLTAPFKPSKSHRALKFTRAGELSLTLDWRESRGWRARSFRSLEKRCVASKSPLARATRRYCQRVKERFIKRGEAPFDEPSLYNDSFCALVWSGKTFCDMRSKLPTWWERSRALSVQYNWGWCAKYRLHFIRHHKRWVLDSIVQNDPCNGA